MKTTETVKKCLQTAAGSEAHAVVQYSADAACLENWGLKKLADKIKEEAREEQGHLDKLLERITFTGGYPEFDVAPPVERNTVLAVIEGQLALEKETVGLYQENTDITWKTFDKGTAHLFLSLLQDEENHLNWLEGQKMLLDKMGEKLYTSLWVEK